MQIKMMKPGNLPHPDNPEDIESGKGSSGMDALNREWHNGVVTGSTTGSTSSSSRDKAFWTKAAGNNKILFAALILCLGAGATAAFLTIGVSGAKSDKRQNFARRATELKMSLETAWGDYETFGLWIHQACRHYDAHTHVLKAPTPQPNTTINGTDSLGSYNDSLLPPLPSICSRQEFRELYEYILSVGVEFQSAQYMPNVTHANRALVEEDSRQFYAQSYPHVNYHGFMGFEPSNETGEIGVHPRSEQPFYFPVHLIEPVEGNEKAIDLDLYSSRIQHDTLLQAISTWKPALTERLKLVQDTDPYAFSVILHHPGVPTSFRQTDDNVPAGVSLMVVRIPDLIRRAASSSAEGRSVFIYDSTHVDQSPVFLGGADTCAIKGFKAREEVSLAQLQSSHDMIEIDNIRIADRQWTIAVVPLPGTYEADLVFVILGGVIIFMATILLIIWSYTNMTKSAKFVQMKATAEAEKAAIILETAKKQAISERELNDFIAHEVRNPLSSAIAALSFVTSSLANSSEKSHDDTESTVKDDLVIIDSSLKFINELLRNMLDVHRASNNQMKITLAPTDVRNDILDPVAAMMFLNGNKSVDIQTECPTNLFVETDQLRIKQVILNLANNAVKFVENGFIRIRANVVNGNVRFCIEDSGPGIPPDKRKMLFAKFQESLDLLNQGTGIGLSLCKSLTELMGGSIKLDETYDSGVPGFPGTRFIVDLQRPPLQGEEERNVPRDVCLATDDHSEHISADALQHLELPLTLSVLFVDDDTMIRKLFLRSLKRVAPSWICDQAANGEKAILMSKSKNYDIIFVDQYMASISKQLLGTETVRAMRCNGCKALICGLSANDMEQAFLEAGANFFLFKPFKCEAEEMRAELCRMLGAPRNNLQIPATV